MSIRIVTDSVTDIPAAWRTQYDITVVPAYINIGDRSLVDGIDVTHETFYAQMVQQTAALSTAAASAGAFTAVFNELAAGGATDIIAIHISAKVSNYFNAARVGAEAADGVRVHLFDTGQLTLGAGFLVRRAAIAAQENRPVADILRLLETLAPRAHVYGYIDTLEYLRRSGRIGWTQAGLGTLLRVKPIFHVRRGDIDVIDRVRTRRRAQEQIAALLHKTAPHADLAYVHTAAPEAVAELRAATRDVWPNGEEPPTYLINPAFGVHIGPGAVGFATLQEA